MTETVNANLVQGAAPPTTRVFLKLVGGSRRHRFGVGSRLGRLLVVETGRLPDGHKCFRLRCLDCGRERSIEKWRVLQVYRDKSPTLDCECVAPPKAPRKAVDPVSRLRATYRASAKARGLTFDLTDDEFAALIAMPCDYCASPPSNGKTGPLVYSGIDRVDSKMGYIAGNVVPCCRRCNYAKGTATRADFVAWVIRVAQHLARRSLDTYTPGAPEGLTGQR